MLILTTVDNNNNNNNKEFKNLKLLDEPKNSAILISILVSLEREWPFLEQSVLK